MLLNRKIATKRTTPGTINALILDDHDFDRARIRRLAKRSKLPFNIVEAPSLDVMEQAIKANNFDVFLMDYELPIGNGLDAVKLVEEYGAQKDAALIMITGRNQMDLAVSAFREGYHDVITKEDLSPTF